MTEPTSPPEAEPTKGLARLREEFPAEHVGKLPRGKTKTAKDTPGVCKPRSEGGAAPDWQDYYCGGWHALPAVHLDYVGHAAVTDRLLEVDPEWNWEPIATDEHGRPVFERDGKGQPVGLWIKLTILGITRLGFGSVESGKFEAEKQLIGDALRNAAMRFGVALDLWIKGHADEEDDRQADPPAAPPDPKLAGWASRDEAQAAHTPLRDAMVALPDEAKGRLAAWRMEHDLTGWPLPKAAFDDVAAQVDALVLAADLGMLDPDAPEAAGAVERTETPPDPPEAPTEPQGTAGDAYDLPPLDGERHHRTCVCGHTLESHGGVEGWTCRGDGIAPCSCTEWRERPEPGPDDCPDCGHPRRGHGGKGCADCFCERLPASFATSGNDYVDENPEDAKAEDLGHCSACGGAIWRDDIGLWNHADDEDREFCRATEPGPAGPEVDVDALYAAVRAPNPPDGTEPPELSIEAQIEALTPTQVMLELTTAGLSVAGTQKGRRERLLTHRRMTSGVAPAEDGR